MVFLSIIFISLVGTILHFTYEWSNNNKVVGIISAVNESVWEHIKMSLSASLIWMIIDSNFILYQKVTLLQKQYHY